MSRRWARWVLLGAGAVVLGGLVFIGARLYPLVRDDVVLDGIVRAVALDWRDFGEDKARERLQYELDHQGIGLQVRDESCALSTVDDRRVVRCSWSGTVDLLLFEPQLAFSSEAAIDPEGALR